MTISSSLQKEKVDFWLTVGRRFIMARRTWQEQTMGHDIIKEKVDRASLVQQEGLGWDTPFKPPHLLTFKWLPINIRGVV